MHNWKGVALVMSLLSSFAAAAKLNAVLAVLYESAFRRKRRRLASVVEESSAKVYRIQRILQKRSRNRHKDDFG